MVDKNILRATDVGDVSVLVLFDLSAAFDIVDHDVLLDVLCLRIGIEDRALVRFRSYRSNHTQSFCVAFETSSSVIPPCSVPQWPVIGPQKFTAYTEDIVETMETFSVYHRL